MPGQRRDLDGGLGSAERDSEGVPRNTETSQLSPMNGVFQRHPP